MPPPLWRAGRGSRGRKTASDVWETVAAAHYANLEPGPDGAVGLLCRQQARLSARSGLKCLLKTTMLDDLTVTPADATTYYMTAGTPQQTVGGSTEIRRATYSQRKFSFGCTLGTRLLFERTPTRGDCGSAADGGAGGRITVRDLWSYPGTPLGRSVLTKARMPRSARRGHNAPVSTRRPRNGLGPRPRRRPRGHGSGAALGRRISGGCAVEHSGVDGGRAGRRRRDRPAL